MKLINEWKESWKFTSSQLGIAISLLAAIAAYLDAVGLLWGLSFFITGLLIPLVRIIKQETKRNETPE